ncbi:helix-turn-helix domain-containing protein [Bordetella petrii]|nr:helix-turn-helix domain-containing protein [Bordetella petrii]
MTLAERLRTQMQWRGIKSQNQLARISGVPQSSIHRILTRNDAYAPARGTLQRLAAALDTTVPWLADGIDAAAPSASPAPGMAGPAAGAPDGYSAELHALMGKLPVEARKKIVAVVRLIVDGGGVAGTPQNTARPGQ